MKQADDRGILTVHCSVEMDGEQEEDGSVEKHGAGSTSMIQCHQSSGHHKSQPHLITPLGGGFRYYIYILIQLYLG